MGIDEPQTTGFETYSPVRWIQAQRLALGTALLAQLRNPTSAQQHAVFRRESTGFQKDNLWPTHQPPSGKDLAKYLLRLQSMPPATLEALCALDQNALSVWGGHHAIWAEALNAQKWEEKSEEKGGNKHDVSFSPRDGAKLIAEIILSGTANAPQLKYIARRELGQRWTGCHGIDEALAELLGSIGGNAAPTETRLRALANFRQRFNGAILPPRWELVENAILQASLSWPLLVAKSGGTALGYTLPLEISISFDSRKQTQFLNRKLIECEQWEQSVDRARDAASTVWLNDHAAWDFSFKKAVRDASIIVDFRIAESILEPFASREPFFLTAFRLTGSSLETYVALLMLGRLIDPRAMETTCATGKLGSFLPNGGGQHRQDGGDYIVEPLVDEISKKLKIECVEKTFFTDHVIVPAAQPTDPRIAPNIRRRTVTRPIPLANADAETSIRVSEGSLLSDFADLAFGQVWKRHRYVRCPDLAYEFKRPALTQQEEAEIRTVRDALQKSTSPIVELDASISAVSVARALKKVNDDVALDAERNIEGLRLREQRNRAPKRWESVGSFIFARATQDEINGRFWHAIWHLLHGSREEYFQLSFDISQNAPADILAKLLNRFRPSGVKAGRAPDVLVIIGSDHLRGQSAAIQSGPFSRLRLPILMDRLGTKLVRSPKLWRQIGNTRIILVPKDWTSEPSENIAAPLEPELRDAFRRLSVFRHGFSEQMARAMLPGTHIEFSNTMQRLLKTKIGDRFAVEYAERATEYFLPIRAKWPKSGREIADLHFAAANAIVGFLARDNLARFNFKAGLMPACVHEAQWHVKQATEARSDSFHEYQYAAERLSRIGEPFGWSRVRYEVKHSNQIGPEVLEAAENHLDEVGKRNWIVHPIELVLVAKLAFLLERADKGKAAHYKTLREKLLARAFASCADYFDHVGEGNALRFLVATSRACMTMQDKPNELGRASAWPDVRLARQFESDAKEILDPEWFEFLGDALRNDQLASYEYKKGIWNNRIGGVHGWRIETIVKYLGACDGASISPSADVLSKLPLLPHRAIERGVREKPHAPDSGLHELEHVRRRWKKGRQILLQLAKRSNSARRPKRSDGSL